MKISIITVVRNRSHTIGDALSSLRCQVGVDYEHIIQDCISNDGTLDILNQFSDDRQFLVSEPDGGIYDALNRALSRCNGDVIGLLHSDDLFAHPRVLAQVADSFNSSGADAVYGDLVYVSATDTSRVLRYWRAGRYQRGMLSRGWMPPHPTLFLRREVVEQWGNYDTSFQISADYDSILRYFGSGNITSVYIPEVLVRMRIGGESNKTIGKVIKKSCEDFRALRTNNIGGLISLAMKNFRKFPQILNRNN